MKKNQWMRSVSFNVNNPEDKKRLELIGRKSFSKFIKKLLDEEIKRQQKALVEPATSKPTPTPTTKVKMKPTTSETLVTKPKVFNPMLQR